MVGCGFKAAQLAARSRLIRIDRQSWRSKKLSLCGSSRWPGTFSCGVPMFDNFSVHDAEHVEPRRAVGFILECGIDVVARERQGHVVAVGLNRNQPVEFLRNGLLTTQSREVRL